MKDDIMGMFFAGVILFCLACWIDDEGDFPDWLAPCVGVPGLILIGSSISMVFFRFWQVLWASV